MFNTIIISGSAKLDPKKKNEMRQQIGVIFHNEIIMPQWNKSPSKWKKAPKINEIRPQLGLSFFIFNEIRPQFVFFLY